MTRVPEDATAKHYDFHHGHFGYRGKPRVRALQRFLATAEVTRGRLPGMSCLEAGGSGNKARTLALMGCKEIHYIDLSETNTSCVRQEAERRGLPIGVTQGSMLDPHPELDGRFDLIICDGVIHHTVDPALGLLHMRNWLKKDGILFVNCYRSGSLWYFWIEMVRQMVAQTGIAYADFLELTALSPWKIPTLALIDDGYVPLLHPIDAVTFTHDLEVLGFRIVRTDRDLAPHATTRPMLEFVARKNRDTNVTVDELKYHAGHDQFDLDYDDETRTVIREFHEFKKHIAASEYHSAMAVLASLSLTRAFFEACEMEGPPVLWKLRALASVRALRVLRWRRDPRAYFYRQARALFAAGTTETR